jgi:CCR4-NOT transcription complex subunit 6
LDDSDPSTQERFSVMSWNILCDKYCTQSQYGYTPSTALSWDHRKELILGELQGRDPDFICLQEMETDAFHNYFREALAHSGYKGVFWPKSRARTMAEKEAKLVDGCAMFFKNDKYEDSITLTTTLVTDLTPDISCLTSNWSILRTRPSTDQT